MKKNRLVKKVFTFWWRDCQNCMNSVRFEKIWRLIFKINSKKIKMYLCDNCCKSEKEAKSSYEEVGERLNKKLGEI